MKDKKPRSTSTWIFPTIFCILIIFSTLTQASIPEPIIGEDDTYVKNISIGETDVFNWTIYKNSTTNYVVTVSVQGFENWDQQVSPSYFVLDDVEPYKIIGLKVTIPPYPEKEIRDAIVTFTFRPLNTSDTIVFTKQVTVHVVGATPFGEENSILGLFQNPLPSPFNTPFVTFTLNVALWIFIAFIVYFFIKKILIEIAKKTETLLDDKLIDIMYLPIIFIIALFGTIQSIFLLNINLGFRATIDQISMLIFSIVGIYMIYRIFDAILEEITKKKGGKSTIFGAVLQPVFHKIGITVIIIGGLIFALSTIGVEVTTLLAGAGVMGLVIAFAAQDTLSNFFSGIHLLLDGPFKIGDIIYLETGEYCRVENVGMRSTKLYSILDHELIILPNNAIANQKIVNIVKPDKKIRKKIEVGVAYGSDLKKVKEILYSAAKSHPNVVDKPRYKPEVRFTGFGNSSLNFLVYLWIDQVLNQWKVLSDVRTEIDSRFKEENITIPFPQRTVWLHDASSDVPNQKS